MILTSTAKAQHFDPGLIPVLQNLSSLTNPTISCQPFSINLVEGRKDDKDFQNCAIALCGTPSENPTAIVTDRNFKEYTTPQALEKLKKISPQIKKVVEKGLTEKAAELKLIKEAFEKNPIESFQFSTNHSFLKQQIFNSIFNKIISLKIDPKADVKNRISTTYRFPEWADENFKEVARKFAESYKFAYETRPNLFMGADIYTKEEIREKLNNQIRESEEYLEKNPTMPYHKETKIALDFVKNKLASGQAISSGDFGATMFSQLDKEDKFPSPGLLTQCSTPECERAIKSYLANEANSEKINQLIAEAQDKNQLEKEIKNCQASYLSKTIRTGNQAIANKQYALALAAVKKNVLPLFSAHSRELLNKALAKIKPISSHPLKKEDPFTESDFSYNANNYIKQKIDLSKKNSNSLLKRYAEIAEDGDIDDQNDNPCAKLRSVTAWDATEPDKERIYVSDYSCTHDLRGQQAIAHEIGHNISHFFSSLKISPESLKTYLEMRGCVAKLYKKASKTEIRFSVDTNYTEEDMADLIANIAYPEEDLFSCALLKPSFNKNTYRNPQLEPQSVIDPHSEALTRVIMESINKGKTIPYSCQKSMDKSASQMEFNKCLK